MEPLFSIFWILLRPDRVPHFQVKILAANCGCVDGVRWLGVSHVSVTAARRVSIPLQSRPCCVRGGIVNALVARDGRERATMEGASQRSGVPRMNAAANETESHEPSFRLGVATMSNVSPEGLGLAQARS